MRATDVVGVVGAILNGLLSLVAVAVSLALLPAVVIYALLKFTGTL